MHFSVARTGSALRAAVPQFPRGGATRWQALVLLPLLLGPGGMSAKDAASSPQGPMLSLAELQERLEDASRRVLSFQVTGTVCAVVPSRGWVVLQDDSATAWLELPRVDARVQPGSRLRLKAGDCTLTRGRLGIQCGTAPVVNHDGTHPSLEKSGQVYLPAGRQPLRLEWFNGTQAMSLRVDYEGPDLVRREIPPAALWHPAGGTTNPAAFQPD
jgi:hypothetical protein